MISAAKQHRADGVKFQAYDIRDLQSDHPNKARYEKSCFSLDELEELSEYSKNLNLMFWCSCFTTGLLKPLSKFTDTIKIPSTYADKVQFVLEASKYFKNIHLSTGMHLITDTIELMRFYKNVCSELVLYHCVSEYPAFNLNLERIKLYNILYDRVGFSDHSIGFGAMKYAWFLGATYIEKHFVLTEGEQRKKPWCITPYDLSLFNCLIDQEIDYMKDKGLSEEAKRNYYFYKKEYKSLL